MKVSKTIAAIYLVLAGSVLAAVLEMHGRAASARPKSTHSIPAVTRESETPEVPLPTMQAPAPSEGGIG